LYDQSVDPQRLVHRLAASNARLILGLHIFYEFAKTFRSSRTSTVERGKRLFSYLKEYLEADTNCVNENPEILAAEMWAAKRHQTNTVRTLLSEGDRALVYEEAGRLEKGELTERAEKFLCEQAELAATTRKGSIRYLEDHPEVRRHLKSISPESVDRWLRGVTATKSGVELLAGHILGRFPEEANKRDAVEYAVALLNSPVGRFARGVVRADLYLSWRCAHRDSIPADLNDDLYHVLNAVYCDVYATADRRQMEYAPFILSRSTAVAIYDGSRLFEEWLTDLGNTRAQAAGCDTI
jgi:hypothetical protein